MDRSIVYGQKVEADKMTQNSNNNRQNAHRQCAGIMYALQGRGGACQIQNFIRGQNKIILPDHIPRGNSLVSSLSVSGGGQDTEHEHTDNRQFLVWPVHRTFARQ